MYIHCRHYIHTRVYIVYIYIVYNVYVCMYAVPVYTVYTLYTLTTVKPLYIYIAQHCGKKKNQNKKSKKEIKKSQAVP